MKGIRVLKCGIPGVVSNPTDYPRAGNMGIAVKIETRHGPRFRALWTRNGSGAGAWFPNDLACFIEIDVFSGEIRVWDEIDLPEDHPVVVMAGRYLAYLAERHAE